jgi:hypothetical protein
MLIFFGAGSLFMRNPGGPATALARAPTGSLPPGLDRPIAVRTLPTFCMRLELVS